MAPAPLSPSPLIEDILGVSPAESWVSVCDRTSWGRILVGDGDRIKFLHNQSTNDFQNLTAGQGCETVFVTSTARTLDLATAYVLENEILLLVSPQRTELLLKQFDRYIFFDDAVKLTNVTQTLACFTLFGPGSYALLQQLTAKDFSRQPLYHHQQINLESIEIRIASGSDLGLPGYTLFCSIDQAASLKQLLEELNTKPCTLDTWEALRIVQGRPAPDHELTEDYNPLEAGLWQTISFDKGCYIGQETIARLNTYNGVKQRLWGLELDQWASPGPVITPAGEKVGQLTSIVPTPTGAFGLAYIRTKAGGAGLSIQVGDASGTVVPLGYVSHPC